MIASMKNKFTTILFVLLTLMVSGLLFNDNVWFDETYTLALIQHPYGEMMDILRSDMHPPLYFAGLKLFCSIWGYDILITKIYSLLGFVMLLSLGCLIVKKDYGEKTAIFYLLIIGVTPMSFYFAVQQRCYSWSMFFVTWCFLEGMRLLRSAKWQTDILFAITALCAAYNHIYALVAVAGVVISVNICIFFKCQKEWKKILTADALMILGYAGWLGTLLTQTRQASQNFWLTSLETTSLIVLALSVPLFAFLLCQQKTLSESQKCLIRSGIFTTMFVHMAGFGISLLVRPLYIARYASPLLGIFALVTAVFLAYHIKGRVLVPCLLLVCIIEYGIMASFEYNPSLRNFRNEFDTVCSPDDIFIYCDSSFGIMSYYYPDHTHICTYYEPWFDAFEDVEYVTVDRLEDILSTNQQVWLVINEKKDLPKWVIQNFHCCQTHSFQCDFNRFTVWELQMRTD